MGVPAPESRLGKPYLMGSLAGKPGVHTGPIIMRTEPEPGP